jgi:hypothetical protein
MISGGSIFNGRVLGMSYSFRSPIEYDFPRFPATGAGISVHREALHMSDLETIGIVGGVVSGVSGCILGGLSLLHQWLSTRPRIAVRLFDMSGVVAPSNPQKKTVVHVDVCNVGQVPVMMGAIIGFLPKRGQKAHSLIFTPEPPPKTLPNEVILPGELKPQHRAMLTYEFGPGELPEGRKLGRAFVRSAVGEEFKASRREMRRFAKSRKAAAFRKRH